MSTAIARANRVSEELIAAADRAAVLVLICATGDEAEAIQFVRFFPKAAGAHRRARTVVLVGRIGRHTLRLLGAFAKHVVALPATAETQPGGALWEWWRDNRGAAQPWDTLTLDWTCAPLDTKFIEAKRSELEQMHLARAIQ